MHAYFRSFGVSDDVVQAFQKERSTCSHVMPAELFLFQIMFAMLLKISRRSVSDIVELIQKVVSDEEEATISDEMQIGAHVK